MAKYNIAPKHREAKKRWFVSAFLFLFIFSMVGGYAIVPTLTIAADTTYKSPSGTASPNQWSHANNAFASDDSYANTNDDNDAQGYRNFGFVVPQGSTIDGIEVALEAKSEGQTCQLETRLSWNGGSSYTSPKTVVPGATDSLMLVGGPNDTWGRNWSINNFSNSNFRLAVRFNDPDNNCITQSQNDNNNDDIFLDQVQVKVYFTPPVQPAPNPTLTQACGLDIALVMDVSDSINNVSLDTMKAAFNSFVNNFLPGTPTQFSVSKFAENASVVQTFTDDASLIHGAINGATSDNWTNWEGGLISAGSTFDPRPESAHPNLIIFASDGDPNSINGDSDVPTQTALTAAITHANLLKNEGTRIVTLAIGNNLDLDNLEAISSVDAVLTTDDFAAFGATLAGLATEACGGTITVTKLVDHDGNLETTQDQTPASGWEFTVAGQPQVTAENGQTAAVEVAQGTHDITETVQDGYLLASAACQGATNNGTANPAGVSGIEVGSLENVSCTFINSAPFCGDKRLTGQEECDDGNVVDGDGCSANCTLEAAEPVCGNNLLESPEECDDGNVVDGDGCSANCTLEDPLVCEDITQQTGWYGEYFNYSRDHEDMNLPSGQWPDAGHGDPLGSWDTDWYTQPYFRFARVDSSLTFGENFFPFDIAPEEIDNSHEYHFGTHWRGLVTVNAPGDYGYTLTSDDDAWVYLDGVLVVDNSGIHAPVTKSGTLALSDQHVVDIFFAERHVVRSHFSFNWTSEGVTVTPFPADCEIQCEIVELSLNGSFEQPPVVHNAGWDIFPSSQIDGWNIEWTPAVPASYSSVNRPEDALIELHGGVNNWTPAEGEQYAELDTDWAGPDGALNGEPASVKAYQDIPTIPGKQYTVSLSASARPGTGAGDNILEIGVDNSILAIVSEGNATNNTNWHALQYDFTATSTVSRIYLADRGTSDSLGTFVDNFSVMGCAPEPICTDNDKDGYYLEQQCADQPIDCNDENSGANPGATEICADQIDNDCDGQVDENCQGGSDGGSICGYKFEDVDGDGKWDEGEPGLGGWTINLTAETEGPAIEPTVTNQEDGSYCFTELPAGTYTVAETLQDGWVNTTDLAVTDVVLPEDGSVDNINFGNFKLAKIWGYKYEDRNGNGWDENDGQVSDLWEFFLVSTPTPSFSTSTFTTNDSGNGEGYFEFNGIGPGQYLLTEGAKTNWFKVWPVDVGHFITVLSGAVIGAPRNDNGSVNFLNDQREPACSDGIDNDQDELIDSADPGCSSPEDDSETDGSGQTPACSDGIDNDQDELIDSADPGCSSPEDTDETDEPQEVAACSDGIDNDGDQLIDTEDPGCSSPQDNDEANVTITTTGGGGGGGGGGSSILTITNELLVDALTSSVTVTWHTNKPATSRVVYDTASHDPVSGPGPNYGYAFSTSEDSTKVLFHSMTINGLTPGTQYFFRPISAASPEIYGVELTASTNSGGTPPTTPGGGGEENPGGNPPGGPETASGSPAATGQTSGGETGTVAGAEFAEAAELPNGQPGGAESDEPADDGQVLAESTDETRTPQNCAVYIWILLLLNIIASGYAWYRFKNSNSGWRTYLWLIGALLSIVPTIIWYPACGLWIWLLIVLVGLLIALFIKEQEQGNSPA